MKKIISNKGQISLEFALLFAVAVSVAAIAGFYYVKSTKSSSITSEKSSVKGSTTTSNKDMELVDSIEEVITNEGQ
ncbi:class III signal peptide domain-containing protein, archaeosortase D/PIP-CTERM system-associated [Methanotorris igneus]|uniref:Class III signal peptide-containing protein n=1 Tax=Methanotorris igneus (strain DSM 5666 / JCM 11834 / Kol 5) TaxID=880724 RepID=F6BDF0_METIK|nr:class III signal peptide domain-containing protein, archaeosortase D/PIP-CTERM system-associated [Methanotorris igneus]AEF96511.1 Class III signal peptide-containing protein [Methanotorris igneus Kol 5]